MSDCIVNFQVLHQAEQFGGDHFLKSGRITC